MAAEPVPADHFLNVEFEAGKARNSKPVPASTEEAQSEPQLIPSPVTVPEPDPVLLTLIVTGCGGGGGGGAGTEAIVIVAVSLLLLSSCASWF